MRATNEGTRERTEARSPVSIVHARHRRKRGAEPWPEDVLGGNKADPGHCGAARADLTGCHRTRAAPQCPRGSQESLLRLNTPQELNDGTFRRGHPPVAVSPTPPKPNVRERCEPQQRGPRNAKCLRSVARMAGSYGPGQPAVR